jgi:hypothetical protein
LTTHSWRRNLDWFFLDNGLSLAATLWDDLILQLEDLFFDLIDRHELCDDGSNGRSDILLRARVLELFILDLDGIFRRSSPRRPHDLSRIATAQLRRHALDKSGLLVVRSLEVIDPPLPLDVGLFQGGNPIFQVRHAIPRTTLPSFEAIDISPLRVESTVHRPQVFIDPVEDLARLGDVMVEVGLQLISLSLVISSKQLGQDDQRTTFSSTSKSRLTRRVTMAVACLIAGVVWLRRLSSPVQS